MKCKSVLSLFLLFGLLACDQNQKSNCPLFTEIELLETGNIFFDQNEFALDHLTEALA